MWFVTGTGRVWGEEALSELRGSTSPSSSGSFHHHPAFTEPPSFLVGSLSTAADTP